MKLKTGTKELGDKHVTWFTVGVQTFYLLPVETKKEAKWYREMLDIALQNIYKEGIRSTGTILMEDASPAFKATIERINKIMSK